MSFPAQRPNKNRTRAVSIHSSSFSLRRNDEFGVRAVLPPEVVVKVLNYVREEDFSACSCVSRRWSELTLLPEFAVRLLGKTLKVTLLT